MRQLTFACLLAAMFSTNVAHAITVKTIPPYSKPNCHQQAPVQTDMVFVLDTTGSMGGLIQGAKTKIWRIVNDVMQQQRCGADVRVGLVAYRDKGDDYVTRQVKLNQDLDAVYTELMAFEAAGGGDEPEHVRQALFEGVSDMGWRSNSKKVLFLVGDAPPQDAYQESPSTTATAKKAKTQGIIINTLLAGNSQETAKVWRSVAQYGGGEYFEIPQDGGSRMVTTPYDQRLYELSRELDQKYLPYGTPKQRHAASAKMSKSVTAIAAAPMEAQAERSINKSLNHQAYSQDDLLQSIENKQTSLAQIKTADLPENMQAMSAQQRSHYIAAEIAQRQQLRDDIAALSKQRAQYLNQPTQNQPNADSFDQAVGRALEKQLR